MSNENPDTTSEHDQDHIPNEIDRIVSVFSKDIEKIIPGIGFIIGVLDPETHAFKFAYNIVPNTLIISLEEAIEQLKKRVN